MSHAFLPASWITLPKTAPLYRLAKSTPERNKRVLDAGEGVCNIRSELVYLDTLTFWTAIEIRKELPATTYN